MKKTIFVVLILYFINMVIACNNNGSYPDDSSIELKKKRR